MIALGRRCLSPRRMPSRAVGHTLIISRICRARLPVPLEDLHSFQRKAGYIIGVVVVLGPGSAVDPDRTGTGAAPAGYVGGGIVTDHPLNAPLFTVRGRRGRWDAGREQSSRRGRSDTATPGRAGRTRQG